MGWGIGRRRVLKFQKFPSPRPSKHIPLLSHSTPPQQHATAASAQAHQPLLDEERAARDQMSRYPQCFNRICDRLMERGVGLRRQTRSDVWWIMGTIDMQGDVIPRQFRTIRTTMKSRFQEVSHPPFTLQRLSSKRPNPVVAFSDRQPPAVARADRGTGATCLPRDRRPATRATTPVPQLHGEGSGILAASKQGTTASDEDDDDDDGALLTDVCFSSFFCAPLCRC